MPARPDWQGRPAELLAVDLFGQRLSSRRAAAPTPAGSYVNDPNGTRTFVPYGTGVGNAANPYDGYSYQRQDNRVNAGGFVTLQLSPEFELYGSALWFRDKSINRYPTRVFAAANYGSDLFRVNCNNPFLSTRRPASSAAPPPGRRPPCRSTSATGSMRRS